MNSCRRSTRSRLVALLVLGASLASASAALAAESFGPVPAASQSRCAPAHGNRRILNIGQLFIEHAGPITAACGGPSSSTHYTWDVPGDEPGDMEGLVQLHPCPRDSRKCVFRAVDFTQPGMYQGAGITGSSPFGGWGSDVLYAIRYGNYFNVYLSVAGAVPPSVSVRGNGRHVIVKKASSTGGYDFVLTRGTYTFTAQAGSRSFHGTVHLSAQPGKYVNVSLTRTAATAEG